MMCRETYSGKLPRIKIKYIRVRHDVHIEVTHRQWHTTPYVCNIVMCYVSPIYYYHTATTSCSHFGSFLNDNSCILIQSNADCSWLSCDCLYQPTKSSSRIEVCVYNDLAQKSQSYTQFHLTFQIGLCF